MLAGVATGAVAAEEEEVLEEVVVTAQFREQNVQDTPLAITAVSAEMLEARSQTNVTEIANQAPNVTLKPQSPMFGPSIAAYIRGIGAGDFNPALEPGVGIYVDDVYIATLTGSMLDLLDLDRVEILRGPQGTLAGRNSIGGAVKLYSKKPDAVDGGSFQVTYGSRNRLDLRGTANFALTDSLFLRISGVDKSQEGYIDRIDYGCAFPGNPQGIPSLVATTAGCVVSKDSNVNYSAGRAALRWLPSERLEVNFAADYTNDRRNPTGAVLVDYRDATQSAVAIARIQPSYDGNPANNIRPSAFVTPRGSYHYYASFYSPSHDGTGEVTNVLLESRPVPRQWFEGWGASLDLDYSLSDSLGLRSITAYREYESGFVNDNDLSPLASSIGDGSLPFRSLTQELRLNGGNDAVDYTLGAYFLDQRSRYQSWQDLRYTGPLQFQQNDVVNVETWALFGHVGWNITDQFVLTTGLRYTDEHKDYNYIRRTRDGALHPSFNTPPNLLDGQRNNYDGDQLDYRVAAQYSWNDAVMTYLQYATGFKGGGTTPRPFNLDQLLSFGSETLKSWELGAKADLLGRRLRVNTAVFFGDYTDVQMGLQQCPVGPPVPCGVIANAGDAELKGFELEAVVRPVRNLSVDASYSYTDFEWQFLSPATQPLSGVGGIQMWMTTPFLPKSKASLGAQYEFTLANGSTLAPRVDASFQSELWTNGNNSVNNRIGGYTLFNARMVWRNAAADLEVALEGTNLGDKYYYLSRADQYTGAGHTDAQPGRPREWAVTLKKRF
jgi:iron complex outermembrane receptor protein